MLNTNVSFSKAREYGFFIEEDKIEDSITIVSPFQRKVLTVIGEKEGTVKLKFYERDLIQASRVDIDFESILGKNMLRVDIEVEEKNEKCCATIIETREKVKLSMH